MMPDPALPSRSLRAPFGLAALLAGVSALGCGGGGSVAGAPPAGPAPTTSTYSAGPFTVKAGTELVMCTFVQGENAEDLDVSEFSTLQSAGGHHLIVYTVDHAIDLPPTLCSQGGQPGWNQILGSQSKQDKVTFPAGVGFHIKAHQQFVMETHYIDATTADLMGQSSFTLTYAPAGSVTQRAAAYFFGTQNIDVPANGTFSKEATCSPPFPMTLHSMAGHQHRHGTKVTVGFAPAGKVESSLYESTSWDAPSVMQFDKGLAVGVADKLHVTCDWTNDSPDRLRYPHEMCYAIGVYWPAESALFCASGGGSDACQCQTLGTLDTGPGGSTVKVNVTRAATVSGSVGDLGTGAPIYCTLYRAQDWGGLMPNAGAQPYYFNDAVDVPLPDATATTTITMNDVTPGDYRAVCYMDTIGGGIFPGKGDPLSATAPMVTAVAGQTATTDVHLDFAFP